MWGSCELALSTGSADGTSKFWRGWEKRRQAVQHVLLGEELHGGEAGVPQPVVVEHGRMGDVVRRALAGGR